MKSALAGSTSGVVVVLIGFSLHKILVMPSIDPLRITGKGTNPVDSLMWNSVELRPT